MISRKECFPIAGLKKKIRILHISDVHFSVNTSYEKNQKIIAEILRNTDFCTGLNLIAVTGDLISRILGETSISDALELLNKLRRIAPVVYSLGNHESDLPKDILSEFLKNCRKSGILVLNNSSVLIQDMIVTGLTLPREIYKNQDGHYSNLMPVTEKLLLSCIGACISHPCVLLAHSPMGFETYAQWGADVVLSGHVHGGIIRMPVIGGILSPERRFFPKYAKGVYQSKNIKTCYMNVSAGIGKFRVNNPSEIVCIDLVPVSA